MAFERVEGPLGPRRGDFHAAQVAAAIAQANSSKRRRYKLSDFLIRWDRGRARQSGEEILRTVRAWNRRLGGTEVTAGGDS